MLLVVNLSGIGSKHVFVLLGRFNFVEFWYLFGLDLAPVVFRSDWVMARSRFLVCN